jgi:2-polyprenyl-3-methyl-5-hydroxy-6-metoxy-1,4-benzoquinol methylase
VGHIGRSGCSPSVRAEPARWLEESLKGICMDDVGLEREKNKEYYDNLWSVGVGVYEAHPTGRHRRRFINKALRSVEFNEKTRIFDYGCGTGVLLRDLKSSCQLKDTQLSGCDISSQSIKMVREHFPEGSFYEEACPDLTEPFSVFICSEVLEHTSEYEKILVWASEHLGEGGIGVITTPGTPMDPPDVSYGHIQHFEVEDITRILKRLNLQVLIARRWGFPFFTLQKMLTKRYFKQVENSFIEGGLPFWKRMIFNFAYGVYFLHDLIPKGPQIFILFKKIQGHVRV